MSKTTSQTPSTALPGRPISRISLFVHGRPERIGDAPDRVRRLAKRLGVEVVDDHTADLIVVLGGDGTMLRALHEGLASETPCLGVNFGRVGFLTSIDSTKLESGLERAWGGDYEELRLPTIDGDDGSGVSTGINDIVLSSALIGRMAMLEWCVDGNVLGDLGCDGAILATSTGSTAYNLSVGGPVLAWGLDGFVVSFVSPHSLHARPMVLGRPHTVEMRNLSVDVPVQVIVDGHIAGMINPGGRFEVRLGDSFAHLARLTDTSFFTRYRQTFSG
jgi:NAD+ kinase